MDLQLDASLDSGLIGRAAYTYVYTDDARTGGTLSNSPHTLVKVGISVPVIRKWALASWDAEYVSRRGTLAGGSVPSYVRMNATLLAKEIGHGFQFSASIYNLTNRKYWDPGAEEHVQDRILQDGRAFRLKLTYKFGTHR